VVLTLPLPDNLSKLARDIGSEPVPLGECLRAVNRALAAKDVEECWRLVDGDLE
jgi:hypothetical protein